MYYYYKLKFYLVFPWIVEFVNSCISYHPKHVLTLTLLNFFNGIILPFLQLSIIIFTDMKMSSWCWSANSIEPGMDVQADLALYWWQRLITFCSNRIRVNVLTWVDLMNIKNDPKWSSILLWIFNIQKLKVKLFHFL